MKKYRKIESLLLPCTGSCRKSFVIVVLVLFGMLFSSLGFAGELSGREIMQKVYARETGNTVASTMEMILIGGDGQKRIREMKAYTKKSEKLTKRVVFFQSPADVRGTALLTYDYFEEGLEDEQWIYLPAMHKTKRISAGNKSGSFMGSDFSYGDLTQKSLESHTYKLLKVQEKGLYKEWIIEALPINEEMVNTYGYSKSLFIVRQDNCVVTGAVHWPKNQNSIKYYQVTKLKKIDGIWTAMEVHAKTMNSGKTVHQTFLINREFRLNQPIDDELFSKHRLEQGQ